MSILRLSLFLVSLASFSRVSIAHPYQCDEVNPTQSWTTQFVPVTVQPCDQCPTITVSAMSEVLTLTEMSVTSSSIYCPTPGTYTYPIGTIVPTSVPCYSDWSAYCTIERALPYSDYVIASAGGTVTVDTNVYVKGICIRSGS